MSCVGKLAVTLFLCHVAGAMHGMQFRAQALASAPRQESVATATSARQPAHNFSPAGATQQLAPQSHLPSISPLDPQDFSPETQRAQPGAEGLGTRPFAEMHRFWDRENVWLFAGVATARSLDYTSTLNMRRRGRQEILLTNSVVDNHPLFAGIEALGAGASVAVSYWLHRTQHHRLERWVSVVHIGVASGGAVRNYSLKTFHASSTQ